MVNTQYNSMVKHLSYMLKLRSDLNKETRAEPRTLSRPSVRLGGTWIWYLESAHPIHKINRWRVLPGTSRAPEAKHHAEVEQASRNQPFTVELTVHRPLTTCLERE